MNLWEHNSKIFQREWISPLAKYSFIIDKIWGDWLSTPCDHGPSKGFTEEKKYADLFFVSNEQVDQVLLSMVFFNQSTG